MAGAGTLNASTVQITSQDASIGTNAAPVLTGATMITAQTNHVSNATNIYIQNSSAVTIGGAGGSTFSASNNMSVGAGGALTVATSLTEGNAITLYTTAAGDITTGNGVVLTAPSKALQTNSGNIENSGSTAISTATASLAVNAGGNGSSTGNAVISNNQAVTLNTSAAAGTLNLTNAGTITIAGNVNSNASSGSSIVLDATGSGSTIVEQSAEPAHCMLVQLI